MADPLLAGGLLAGLALVLSWLLSWLMRWLAPRIGLVDVPGGRKAHKAPTPLGGGIAIWLATVLTLVGVGLLAGRLSPTWASLLQRIHADQARLLLVLGLGTILLLMGLLDDVFGLPWKTRLTIQLGLAGVLVASGVRLTLFPPISTIPLLAGSITVLWIVALTNAFNFLDNMDGLAAGVALIAGLLLAGAQLLAGEVAVPAVLLVISGALTGFLIHNFYPARMFMGDAGSNFLGFLLGALTVMGTFTRPGSIAPIDGQSYTPFGVLTPLLVMAVPLYDMMTVVTIRLREGRSPFQGDRRHFSHRLVDKGLSPPQAVGTIYLVTLAIGLGALLLHRLDAFGTWTLIAQTACLLGVVAILEAAGRPPEGPSRSAQSSNPNAPRLAPTTPEEPVHVRPRRDRPQEPEV